MIPTFRGDLNDNELIKMGRILIDVAKDPRSSKEIQRVIDEIKSEYDLWMISYAKAKEQYY